MHPAALGSASRSRAHVSKPPAVGSWLQTLCCTFFHQRTILLTVNLPITVGNYSAAALKVSTSETQMGQPIFTQTNQPLRDSEGNPFFECHVDGWFCAVRRFVSREMDEGENRFVDQCDTLTSGHSILPSLSFFALQRTWNTSKRRLLFANPSRTTETSFATYSTTSEGFCEQNSNNQQVVTNHDRCEQWKLFNIHCVFQGDA